MLQSMAGMQTVECRQWIGAGLDNAHELQVMKSAEPDE
jgi:hypothetical protein